VNPDIAIPIVMIAVGLLLAAGVIAAVVVIIRKYFTTKQQEIGASHIKVSDVRDIRQALIDNAKSQQAMADRLAEIERRIAGVEKTLTEIP
jgi:low affinity Fe/Cu permease